MEVRLQASLVKPLGPPILAFLLHISPLNDPKAGAMGLYRSCFEIHPWRVFHTPYFPTSPLARPFPLMAGFTAGVVGIGVICQVLFDLVIPSIHQRVKRIRYQLGSPDNYWNQVTTQMK